VGDIGSQRAARWHPTRAHQWHEHRLVERVRGKRREQSAQLSALLTPAGEGLFGCLVNGPRREFSSSPRVHLAYGLGDIREHVRRDGAATSQRGNDEISIEIVHVVRHVTDEPVLAVFAAPVGGCQAIKDSVEFRPQVFERGEW
jgi:hypothetical protein